MNPHKTERKYEAPAIVYEGTISTRAGSTRGADTNSAPIDLFKNNNNK